MSLRLTDLSTKYSPTLKSWSLPKNKKNILVIAGRPIPSLKRFFSKSEKESPFSILNINSSFLKFTEATEIRMLIQKKASFQDIDQVGRFCSYLTGAIKF